MPGGVAWASPMMEASYADLSCESVGNEPLRPVDLRVAAAGLLDGREPLSAVAGWQTAICWRQQASAGPRRRFTSTAVSMLFLQAIILNIFVLGETCAIEWLIGPCYFDLYLLIVWQTVHLHLQLPVLAERLVVIGTGPGGQALQCPDAE